MPTYDYRCESCEHRFELAQSIKDDPLAVCPDCGEATLVKVFGVPGIAFKGSGFYKTDNRSSSSSSGGSTGANGSSSTSSDGDSGSSSSASSSSTGSDSASGSTSSSTGSSSSSSSD